MTSEQQLKHLWLRTSFSAPAEQMRNARSLDDAITKLFPKEAPKEITEVLLEEYQDIRSRVTRLEDTTGDAAVKRRTLHEIRRSLNARWMQEMVDTSYPLREIMSIFWHGHFATRVVDPYMNQQMVNLLRKHSLGSFRDLLHAVSRSAIMLNFLNSRQNVKAKPNENFAREVMELFTLGIGNYSEHDIKEGARAFTGWTYDKDFAFTERPNQHDAGNKTFLGKTGNFDGNDVLNILLEQKQTARYICAKICKYFVGEAAIAPAAQEKLAMQFYESDYDISKLLQNVFKSDWFYVPDVIGNRIKPPVELIVSMRRTIPVAYNPDTNWVKLQTLLGQELFLPPNVAGWPGGKAWLRGSALPVRLRLAEALYSSAEIEFTEDNNDETAGRDMTAGNKRQKSYSLGKAEVNWSSYIQQWKNTPQENLAAAISNKLLAKPLSAEKLAVIKRFADKDSVEEYIKSATILIMKMPEYQLS